MRPLDGVRVLEIGTFIAGPFATMQLADLGADVVKIEDPAGGDTVRETGPFLDGHSSPFARLNRNKRSVAIDLKSAEGREIVLRMAEGADVLVQNLRPGGMDQLGLGYPALRERNPRLVYVSASGWGQDGPLAALPGLDVMAQARSGLMSITGAGEGEPAKVGVPICDLVCALYVALAAVSALRAREVTGCGQHVDVSLYESGVSLAIWEAGRYFATGEVGHPLGTVHQNLAPYQAVRTRDGWVTVGAVTPKTWAGLCEALELPELADDPRFGSAYSRRQHLGEVIPAIEAATTQRDTADVLRALQAAGVPCAPIASYDEVFTDEHLAARDYFWDAPHPALGPVRQLGSPMRFSDTPVRRGPAGPRLGDHTREQLAELGYGPAEVDRLIAAGVIGEPVERT